MSGFATDTTIETITVELPNGTQVQVTLERDGVNEDPSVSCTFEDFLGRTPLSDVTYHRTVLIDGLAEVPRLWDVDYEVRSSVDGGAAVLGGGTMVVEATEDDAPQAAIDQVHETDVKADPRIDPFVVVTRIEEHDA